MDRQVTPITTVFDELKDYLSESDLSLDYQIARSRSRNKIRRNSNKLIQQASAKNGPEISGQPEIHGE